MANSDYYDIVNVGSGRLATDGECIRDAFIKINNNNTQIFNTLFDYDTNVLFGGWKLIVGVDNSIVVTNQLSISNSVGVSVMQITEVSNDININIDNSLDLVVANNINITSNSSNVSIVSDVSNNVVLTANSFTSTNVIYAPSLTNTNNTNNITFNSNDIDISNTFGDININAVTNDISIVGDLVVNTNMFDINVTTGDISIQNGAITINNALDVDINNAITVDASQNVTINNALTVDASNNINIGINNSIAIDASQNITFAPSTNIDFTNISTMNLDFNFINQVDVNFSTITNNQVLIYNSTSGNFEPGTISVPTVLSDLNDVFSDPGPSGDGEILIYNYNAGQYENKKPWLNNFAMTDRDIVPDYIEVPTNLGSNEKGFGNVYAQVVRADLIGSVFADDSTMIIDGTDGTIYGKLVGDVTGSVFADDSTLLVDGVAGKIVGPVESPSVSVNGTFNFTTTGASNQLANIEVPDGGSLGINQGTAPVYFNGAGEDEILTIQNGNIRFPDETLQTTAYPGIVSTHSGQNRIEVGGTIATMDNLSVRLVSSAPGANEVEINYDPDTVTAIGVNRYGTNVLGGTEIVSNGNTTWWNIDDFTTGGDGTEFTVTDYDGKIYRVTVIMANITATSPAPVTGDAYCVIERLK